jgi:AraC-like DNA-binding protein
MSQRERLSLHGDGVIATNERLKTMLYRMIEMDGRMKTPVDGLLLTRWTNTAMTDTCFYAPAVGLIVQGRKESRIGSEVFKYGELDCLVNGVDVPSISKMLEATPEKPLFAVSLDLDRSIATEFAAEIPPAAGFVDPLGVSIAPVTPRLMDALTRLVELLDRPDLIPLQAPMLVREIITHVLLGPQGASLRKIFTVGSHSNQVAEAIMWLRANYKSTLYVDALADQVGMALSTFHRQFKKVTSISPLQFQKCLRLYEARRLMLTEDMDANNAGREVGYDNSQHFNREYKRMFGEPPLRDIKRLRKD